MQIEALKAEIARLKKLPKKPTIRPSTLPKDDNKSDDDDPNDSDHSDPGGRNQATGKTTKPRKRKKKLTIHHTCIIKPDGLLKGSRLLGYENYTIQELLIQPHNTRYRLARYRTPEGKNGFCTHIGNPAFAWFASTRSKSRINFLELLRGPAVDYTINPAALDYMRLEKLP